MVAGGPGRPAGLDKGYYVKPTVFANVTNDMTIAREEIFGPVLCILGYDDIDQAVEIANDTDYGLAGFVSGADLDKAREVARKIRAGWVTINHAFDMNAPFGGYKHSGNGREWSEFGFHEYLEVKSTLGYAPEKAAQSSSTAEGVAMKCRAAVMRGVGKDWEIREIDLDPPRAGEVLVRMAVAGICHSDDHLFTGDVVPTPEVLAASGQPAPDWFPLLGGHEGAGVVEEVGPGVTTVQPGDHVALSFIPACGSCRFCVNGQSYICDIGASLFVAGDAHRRNVPPASRRRKPVGLWSTRHFRRICGAVGEVRHQDRRRDSFPCRLTRVVRRQHRLGLRDGVGRHRARRHRGRHRHRWRRDERPARGARGRRNICRRGGSG